MQQPLYFKRALWLLKGYWESFRQSPRPRKEPSFSLRSYLNAITADFRHRWQGLFRQVHIALLCAALIIAAIPARLHADSGTPSVYAQWTRVCVDCPPLFGKVSDRTMQLDSAGHVHIVYGTDHAHYAYFDGVNWTHEVIDSAPGVGEYASLALGPDGSPHVSYFALDIAAHGNTRSGFLRHAYRAADGWHVESVGLETPTFTSIAVDAAGYAHIAYLSQVTFTLQYAYQNATGWHFETVDAVGWVGYYPSLALDSAGQPRISYHDSSQTALKIAQRTTTGWQTEVVDNTNAVGYFTSLAIDAADHAHISYFDLTNANLKVAAQHASGWTITVVDSIGDVGRYTSIAVNDAGRAHVSYYDRTNGDLKVAHQTPTSWSVVVVADAEDVGVYSTLDLGPNGYIYISYYGAHALQLATFDATTWRFQSVAEEGNVGAYPALALDGNDRPHIAFYDTLHADLKYAVRQAADWQLEFVDSDGDVGRFAALDVDAQTRPWISYYDATNGELKIARRDVTGWMVSTVDGVGPATQQSGLAIDTLGYPHLTYSQVVNGSSLTNLKYAYRDSTGWHMEVIDSSGQVSGGSALKLDPLNQPHLAYTQAGALRYMVRDQGGWHAEVITAARLALDYGPSLALDRQGWPHIAYSDDHSGEVVYARKTAVGWQLEAVPWAAYASKNVSMALDANGYPHIVYREAFLGRDIIHVYKDSEGWHRQVVDDQTLNVDDESMTKGFVSLALDSAGTPLVAYSSEAPTFDLLLAASGSRAAATASITGMAWYDTLHGDGVHQPEENTGVAGVPITVHDVNGRQVAAVLTDSAGRYLVAGLAPGTYQVRAQSTASLLITSPTTITVTLEPDELREGIDFGFVSTTGVLMQSLVATRQGHKVVVTWVTSRETDNEGFHVLGAATADGVYERLTSQPIASQALGVSGATYRFVNVLSSQLGWYRIVALPSGQIFGPVFATSEDGHKSFLPMVLCVR